MGPGPAAAWAAGSGQQRVWGACGRAAAGGPADGRRPVQDSEACRAPVRVAPGVRVTCVSLRSHLAGGVEPGPPCPKADPGPQVRPEAGRREGEPLEASRPLAPWSGTAGLVQLGHPEQVPRVGPKAPGGAGTRALLGHTAPGEPAEAWPGTTWGPCDPPASAPAWRGWGPGQPGSRCSSLALTRPARLRPAGGPERHRRDVPAETRGPGLLLGEWGAGPAAGTAAASRRGAQGAGRVGSSEAGAEGPVGAWVGSFRGWGQCKSPELAHSPARTALLRAGTR